jgi:hypothetical protein
MITEQQAWTRLAELWSNPELNPHGEVGVSCSGVFRYGLCRLIEHSVSISQTTKQCMLDKLYVELAGDRWLASWTLNGAKVRAAFCRRMARELEQQGAQ